MLFKTFFHLFSSFFSLFFFEALRDFYSQDRPVEVDMAASMALAVDGRPRVSNAGARGPKLCFQRKERWLFANFLLEHL